MSIEALTYVLGLDVGDSTRKLVLVGLANHAHRDGTTSWATAETVATYANCSARTVQRHIGRLLVDGYIREGDQSALPDSIRRDRRPIVYDVALTETDRAAWAAQQQVGRRAQSTQFGRLAVIARGDIAVSPRSERGDDLSPRPGVNLSPREPGQDDTNRAHGVTDSTPRGDTAMSPKPSTNQLQEPTTKSLSRAGARDPAGKGTRLPDDWQPDQQLIDWARTENYPDDWSRRVTEQFKNYWIAAPGAKGRKADWRRTWMNWLMRESEKLPSRSPTSASSKMRDWQQMGQELADNLARRDRGTDDNRAIGGM